MGVTLPLAYQLLFIKKKCHNANLSLFVNFKISHNYFDLQLHFRHFRHFRPAMFWFLKVKRYHFPHSRISVELNLNPKGQHCLSSLTLLIHSTQDLFSGWAHTVVFIVNPDSGGIQMSLTGHWEGLGWQQHWCKKKKEFSFYKMGA